jgi:hypothetical protein
MAACCRSSSVLSCSREKRDEEARLLLELEGTMRGEVSSRCVSSTMPGSFDAFYLCNYN